MWKVFVRLLEYAPLWLFIQTASLIKYEKRIKFGGFIVSFAIRSIPRYRNRVLNNLDLIYPKLTKNEKNDFLINFSRNLGRTFTEFLFNEEFHAKQPIKLTNSEQLEEIYAAKKKKRPIIIVSGHFGPWEAVRAIFKRHGLETAAVYQKSKNNFYQPYHHKVISAGGTPIFQADRKGTVAMIRYLKAGGIVCIMIDQAISGGQYISFLGKPAKTTFAVADLAIRCNALLIPAYSIRDENTDLVRVILESPVPFSTPEAMTKKLNQSLTRRIRGNPTQWYWVHNRWK